MTVPLPRVRVPAAAAPGEIIEIKTLIAHDMESGQRRDAEGRIIPRRILNRFVAAFDGTPFFTAEWHGAVAANPYQAFYFRAERSGTLSFTWTDDDGSVYSHRAALTVG
jgi:sulfur-oxidizing protein SoxZ